MVISYRELKQRTIQDLAEFVATRMIANSPHNSKEYFAMPDSREISQSQRHNPTTDFLNKQRTFLFVEPEPEKGQVGTAGLDLRIGRLVAESDIVMDRVTKKDLIEMPHKILDPGEEIVQDYDRNGNKIYYVTSFEKIRLSSDLEMLVDSKSTTGRVGCMSHGVGCTEEGELITALQPFSFPLKIKCGKTKLSQVVIRYKGTPYMTNDEVLSSKEIKFEGDGVSIENSLTPRGLLMRFNTSLVYRTKKCDEPIDMDAKGELNWRNYFEVIEGNSSLILDRNTLYLLGSLEVIDLKEVCGLLSREQEVLTGTGAWGHFAGIFQPFFRGGITMEYYSHSKRRLKRGDRAGVVIFDKVVGAVNKPENYGGSYQNQKPPLLPKMFKVD